jgi:uncharacterized Zn finger protein
MEIVTQRESGLFPAPKEIEMSCSCPDWADMCKHIAATLYGVGSRLDHEPELFFKLRQVDHLELIAQAGHPEAKPKSTGRKRIARDQLADVFGIELEAQGKTTHPVQTAKPVRPRKSTSPAEKRATLTGTVKPKGKKSSVSGSKTDSRIKPLSAAVPARKTAKTKSAKSTAPGPSR